MVITIQAAGSDNCGDNQSFILFTTLTQLRRKSYIADFDWRWPDKPV
jgi:hypothetical protein